MPTPRMPATASGGSVMVRRSADGRALTCNGASVGSSEYNCTQ
ncbi:hypothetical protein [Pilimelia anulata]|nr:hypothetical protein [Pilimelia anulata]